MTVAAPPSDRTGLTFSDGLAASRLVVALTADPGALQRSLPDGWEVAPYAGSDPRGTALRDDNLVLALHEVHAVQDSRSSGTHPQPRYLAYLVPGVGAWVTATAPDSPVISAVDPRIERWYQEDLAFDAVLSRPLGLDRVSGLTRRTPAGAQHEDG